ncbi:CDF family Co(II)/Ni(II) efflux transporter DmeF [Chitinivibrio alkaliphilus]|uniref:Cation diffusion facilitator family transporter n=1 Tax=Chitinivibrio alkaliphilus ACht1 TaxID=1313304 RepID=U7DCN0_9BACT|nr:CDF family Co(II)/Ni(II) efflux transporter DmeF [Chitinivibrio alkaliphilus]ERP39308.1 cation diffusion facilitator family transporter [Chitinivibrio alkaliphilus ACht1]
MLCETVHTIPDNRRNKKRTILVMGITAVTMIAEVTMGIMSGSMALLSDGIHTGTHTLAFLFTLLAYSFAERHGKNHRFTFGTGKVGVLAGYTSAIALIITALLMVKESIHRLISPQEILFRDALIVAVIGLTINVISACILSDTHDHHHGHDHSHDHHHDHNLRAAYLHVITDALTSLLAIFALTAGMLGGFVWLDPAVGIVGAGVILHWAVGLLTSTGKILLDYTEDEASLQRTRDIFSQQGVAEIRDFHVWRVSPHQRFLMATVKGTHITKEQLLNELRHSDDYAHITIDIVQ